jgi:hypothetical protein
MSLTLEQMKAAFKKEESGSNRPNNYYPFWNMQDGERAVVRFLPDLDQENPLGFMVEKLMHTLTITGERKSVACLKMYNEDCPICKVSAAYYKSDDKINGKKYWRKKQHLVQAIVVEDPLPYDAETGESHAGKVRFLAIGYQLYNVIKDAFEGGELDEIPFAYNGGCDFIIKKTKQGEHSGYSIGSQFARKASDIDPETLAVVTDQMIELKSLIPVHPGLEKVEGMLEAEITGSEYEDQSSSSSDGSSPSTKPADVVPVAKADDSPPDDTSTNKFDDEADQILAQIRARKSA